MLEDQRLRKRCMDSNSRSSEKGEFGNENSEVGVSGEVEDVKDEAESMEERGASESVLERGSVVSGTAGRSWQVLAEAVHVKEDREQILASSSAW